MEVKQVNGDFLWELWLFTNVMLHPRFYHQNVIKCCSFAQREYFYIIHFYNHLHVTARYLFSTPLFSHQSPHQ